MHVQIEPYEPHHHDTIVRLSLQAWVPVFESLRDTLGPAVFQVLFPDWCLSQQRAIEEVCDGEEDHIWVAAAGVPIGFVAMQLHAQDGIGEVYMIAVDPAA